MPLTGCVSFAPLSAELAERLAEQAHPDAPFRQRAQVEMEGYGLFEAVLVADGSGARARLQLLPEVGGKMLDLAIAPERIDGYMPPAGIALTHVRHAHLAPPRHLLAFIAASVLEAITPITSERVLGERAIGGGSELHLRPALEGLEVTAQVDEAGRLLAREYRLRGVRWRERIQGEMRVFEARGLRWSLCEGRRELIAMPPAALFELDLPPELAAGSRAPRP